MSIDSQDDLDGLKEAGRIVRAALDEMERHVRPGMTTAALNEIGAEVLVRNQARAVPMGDVGFPAEVCISVNEEAVHGIPSDRVVRAGDVVKLDVVAEKGGYMADAAITVVVGPAAEEKYALVACAERSFRKALLAARAGRRVNAIGRAVSREVRKSGYAVLRGLAGHGIGRAMHEAPSVPNEYDAGARQRLTKGLVIAIEPMIAMGSGAVYQAPDGWTIKTADQSLAAHYEHTVVITRGRPLLLTA